VRAQRHPARSAGNSAATRRETRRREAEQRAALKPLRDRAAKLLRALEGAHTELAEVEQALADNTIYEPARREALKQLLHRQAELRQRAGTLEAEWIAAEEAVEAATTYPG
jgi:ATP-binding cassette subfamily F protein 3